MKTYKKAAPWLSLLGLVGILIVSIVIMRPKDISSEPTSTPRIVFLPTVTPAPTLTNDQIEREEKRNARLEFETIKFLAENQTFPITVENVLDFYGVEALVTYSWETVHPVGGMGIQVNQYRLRVRIRVRENIYWFVILPYTSKQDYDQYGLTQHDLENLIETVLFEIQNTQISQTVVEFKPDEEISDSFVRCVGDCAAIIPMQNTCTRVVVDYSDEYLIYVPYGLLTDDYTEWFTCQSPHQSFVIWSGDILKSSSTN